MTRTKHKTQGDGPVRRSASVSDSGIDHVLWLATRSNHGGPKGARRSQQPVGAHAVGRARMRVPAGTRTKDALRRAREARLRLCRICPRRVLACRCCPLARLPLSPPSGDSPLFWLRGGVKPDAEDAGSRAWSRWWHRWLWSSWHRQVTSPQSASLRFHQPLPLQLLPSCRLLLLRLRCRRFRLRLRRPRRPRRHPPLLLRLRVCRRGPGDRKRPIGGYLLEPRPLCGCPRLLILSDRLEGQPAAQAGEQPTARRLARDEAHPRPTQAQLHPHAQVT